MKKVLVISTTMRKGGNSELLAEQFAQGARESGNEVETINLRDKTISFCRGCLACQKVGNCVIKDDASIIATKMLSADVIVFATPIYFYEMSGQMKILLDRTNPNFLSDYAYRDIYLIGTAADTSKDSLNGAINGLQGWVDCFGKTKIAGVIYGTGVTDVGEVNSHAQLLKQAHEMGATI